MAQGIGGVSSAPARQTEPAGIRGASSLGPQRQDITPEVFHRFMTYERHLAGHASTPLAAVVEPGRSSTMDPHIYKQGPTSRTIRAIPRKASNAASSPSPSQTCSPDTSVLRVTTAAQRPNHPSTNPITNSKTLSRRLEQLQLSSEDDQHVATLPLPTGLRPGDDARPDHTQFRFPSLPATLTDEGFHYRQRAAQFILLCSQQVSLEHLPMLSRFAMPFRGRSYHSSSKAGARSSLYNPFFSDDAEHHSGVEDDDRASCHHMTGRNPSDDESENLDVDACRSAHLGNKKKRKSGRFSNPDLAAVKTVSDQETKQADLVARAIPSMPSTNARNCVLADKTNIERHPVYSLPQAKLKGGGQQNTSISAPASPFSDRNHTVVRLPPRRPGNEHHKAVLRARIRARLAHAYQKRFLTMHGYESQARHPELAVQPVVDTSTPPPATPERKATPKRVNKAGKRAQAIRGGSSPAKPLTIAEIRAKAAAAAAATAAGGGPSAMTSSPSRAPARVEANEHLPDRRSPSHPKTSAVRLDPVPREHKPLATDPYPNSSMENALIGTPSRTTRTEPSTPAKSTARPVLSLPSSPFEFRMSSAVTLRLRELRSQLDAASSKASQHTAKARDTQAMARIYSEAAVTAPAKDIGRSPARGDAARRSDAPLPPPRAPSGSSTPKPQQKQQVSPIEQKTAPPTSVTNAKAKPKAANGRRNGARKPAAHNHGSGCNHSQATGSALFTADDWICVFCEYELYYGEKPLMLRACRNRKKQVEKKERAKTKLQTALQKKAGLSKGHASGCQHGNGHDQEHAQGCEHTHDDGCHHDHASSHDSDDCCPDHDHGHNHHHHHADDGHPKHDSRQRTEDGHRERCDCGNSIHSSDFDDEDK